MRTHVKCKFGEKQSTWVAKSCSHDYAVRPVKSITSQTSLGGRYEKRLSRIFCRQMVVFYQRSQFQTSHLRLVMWISPFLRRIPLAPIVVVQSWSPLWEVTSTSIVRSSTRAQDGSMFDSARKGLVGGQMPVLLEFKALHFPVQPSYGRCSFDWISWWDGKKLISETTSKLSNSHVSIDQEFVLLLNDSHDHQQLVNNSISIVVAPLFQPRPQINRVQAGSMTLFIFQSINLTRLQTFRWKGHGRCGKMI